MAAGKHGQHVLHCLNILFLTVVIAIPSQNKTNYQNFTRIYGGHNAHPGEYPYMIGLLSADNRTVCGGSLINSYHVLTAAHCLEHRNFHDSVVAVVGGLVNRCQSPLVYNHEQYREVDWWKIHPKYKYTYDPFAVVNDIAIIALHRPFHYNHFIQPIKFPTIPVKHKNIFTLTGWGVTPNHLNITGEIILPEHFNDFVKLPCVLQAGQLAIHRDKVCRKQDSNYHPKSMICAGFSEINYIKGNEANLCSGDSGGPLVYRAELHGIASYGPTGICGFTKGRPSVFTRVSHYVPWIKNVVECL